MKARTFLFSLAGGFFFMLCSAGWSLAEKLAVATMHPVLTHVAEVVGGDKVKVVSVVSPGADLHHFSPTGADVKKLAGVTLILISGKGMETYLDKLKSNLTAGQEIVDVGHNIPSQKIDTSDPTFMCCPASANGAVDPHWWNSVENMQRAGREMADAFAKKDPDHKDQFRENAAAWSKKLDNLKKWAKKELTTVPAERRKLATAHLSLSYFAKEFNFKLIPVQGLSDESKATGAELASALKTIKEQKIAALFPEVGVNPKYLKQLSDETGVTIAPSLIADGNGTEELASFEAAFKHNVQTIVAALKP